MPTTSEVSAAALSLFVRVPAAPPRGSRLFDRGAFASSLANSASKAAPLARNEKTTATRDAVKLTQATANAKGMAGSAGVRTNPRAIPSPPPARVITALSCSFCVSAAPSQRRSRCFSSCKRYASAGSMACGIGASLLPGEPRHEAAFSPFRSGPHKTCRDYRRKVETSVLWAVDMEVAAFRYVDAGRKPPARAPAIQVDSRRRTTAQDECFAPRLRVVRHRLRLVLAEIRGGLWSSAVLAPERPSLGSHDFQASCCVLPLHAVPPASMMHGNVDSTGPIGTAKNVPVLFLTPLRTVPLSIEGVTLSPCVRGGRELCPHPQHSRGGGRRYPQPLPDLVDSLAAQSAGVMAR